jgi:hypothetical protein
MNSLLKRLSPHFLLLCISALAGCSSPQLESLTYEEAVEAYRATGRFENYRCIHLLADDNYKPVKTAQPTAIEIDEVLYLKSDGRLHELSQVTANETEASYGTSTEELKAGYSIVRAFNQSEYGESDDRHVNLWVKTPGGKQTFKTFGDRCGL